ncbi:receptor-like protein EIX2 isoform X2 [Malus domestica]|uniref:receptor-like protein EIX2 isoform X2 n=1 Tax=Malus domestica TaxID=3750 RepID=UPI0010A9E577|nr:receptor-like protein EIX2 isoform X2 [Malus domestica]
MGGIMVLLLLIITLHVNLGHDDANMTMRCTDKEREALLAFKQGLIMDEHSQVIFSSWGTEAAKQDCCRWEGVSCDNQTGHVVQLDLRGNYYLQDNQLTGSIPKWLGASFQKLVILMLSSNHFNGSLPPQLCDLIYIQILDVSVNNISGGIPNCLKKLTTLAQKGNSSLTVEHSYERYDKQISWLDIYVDDEIFTWKGSMQVYRNTLGLVRSIDFSSNRLTGEIPSEISHLVGLVSLNLSRNQLTGQITPDIGKLESLDSLDLSRNHIDGRIPTSLARISRLGVLDLSHNNLIGKIPTGTQLQGFDPSVYAGNPQLCGPPLQKPCDIEETGPDQVSTEEDKDDQLIRYGFYISMGLGFFVGFWGVCGSLIFIREWRYAYFKFLNSLNDWLYVRVVLIKRKLTDA